MVERWCRSCFRMATPMPVRPSTNGQAARAMPLGAFLKHNAVCVVLYYVLMVLFVCGFFLVIFGGEEGRMLGALTSAAGSCRHRRRWLTSCALMYPCWSFARTA